MDIVAGELVFSSSGFLIISRDFAPYNIYLNTMSRQYTIILPPDELRGRPYLLYKTDCISLVAKALSLRNIRKDLVSWYSSRPWRDFRLLAKTGVEPWLLSNGFQASTEICENSILVYGESTPNHLGIVTDGKILHHMPNLLSSLDDIDPACIRGIYNAS